MGKGPLTRLWSVGPVKWYPRDDTGTASVARTRAAALRAARRRLARAALDWAEQNGRPERYRAEDAERRNWPVRQYAEWVSGLGGCPAVPWRWWMLLHDGLTIYGPNGEQEHVAEPDEAAVRRVAKLHRQAEAMTAGLLRGMKAALAKN